MNGKHAHWCEKCHSTHDECPDATEIAACCQEIQRPWDEVERHRRAGIRPPIVETQEVTEGFRTPLGRVLIPAAMLLAAWLACSPAFAQGPPVWGQQPAWRSPGFSSPSCPPIDAKAFYDSINGDQLAAAVVRVSVQDRNGQTSLGSGTLVEAYSDGSGLVVTNNHVVSDAASATSGSVFYRGGRQSQFTIRDADSIWDIAILEVDAPAEVDPVKVSDQPPQRGEPLMIGGYGANNRLEFRAGALLGFRSPRRSYPQEQFELAPCQARQGDSGGPVLNGRGQMVGALWGASPGQTVCTPGSRILAMLRRVREGLGRIVRGKGLQPLPPKPGPVLPGPIAGQPNSPPAQPAPPSNDSTPSEPGAGGGLAGILERLEGIEGKLAGGAKPVIDDAEQIAGDAIKGAGPSIFADAVDLLLPLALKALGVTVGGATGLGGIWGAFKLLKGLGGMLARRRSAAKAAALGQGSQAVNAGAPRDGLSFDPQSIVAAEVSRLASALKTDLQSTLDAKLSIIGQQAKATAEIVAAKPDPAPTFVPTQVDDPKLIALEKAVETFGGLSVPNSKSVNLIYSYRDQLLNQAKHA